MSSYTGFDMAPSAMRWMVRDGKDGADEVGEPIYGVRGCPRHPDSGYDSAVSWSDPMAFRQSEFEERFENGVERTVKYDLSEGHMADWLRSFFHGDGGRPPADVSGTIAVAIPDHASPEERDEVIAGVSPAKYANVSLVWRPVAALLGWMDCLKDETDGELSWLLGRRIFILDLDAGRPELTELACVRHRKHGEWIVPSRMQPLADTCSQNGNFVKECYRAALGGMPEWEQLVEGQFHADLQRAIESGVDGFDAWIRRRGAWHSNHVEFSRELPKDILKALNPVIGRMWKGLKAEDVLLVNGWIARRYEEQILAPFKNKCECVSAISAESVAKGAALFAERLAKGLPTYYDRLPRYCFWDGFKADWMPMFDSEQEVEPGREYRYPEGGSEPRRLKVEKYSDNVSFYVREPSSDDYARRIKTRFTEFLRTELELCLSAVVSPEKGSARFVLNMRDEHAKAIFESEGTAVREIVLRWSDSLNANKSVSVESVPEHQGYVEPQPVLGRIYDSEDNLRMVEEYVKASAGRDFNDLWAAYKKKFNANEKHGIADRVGYPSEPTRGLFGTRYVPNARIDRATRDYAEKCAMEFPYVDMAGRMLKDGMLCQNYCHSSAVDAYKRLIRERLLNGEEPQWNFNFYYAAGYVLGEDPRDVVILLEYICEKAHLHSGLRGKLWWSFFRMLCWHPECRLTSEIRPLLEKSLALLLEKDAHEASLQDRKYLLLAVLYALRIRESGNDLSKSIKKELEGLLSMGDLSNVPFPKTMVPKIDPASRRKGDTLSGFVLRFLKKEDSLADRELGAAMGGV